MLSKLRGCHPGVLLHVLVGVVLLPVRIFVLFKLILLLRLLGLHAISTAAGAESCQTHVVVHLLAELLLRLMMVVAIGLILAVLEVLLLLRWICRVVGVHLRHWLWPKVGCWKGTGRLYIRRAI